MGKAAVEAARAIGYSGAGTVEFIVDGSGPLRADGFWFMEMNTRLQVEHPVTEAITGLDLVALQLQVAAGDALPFGQDDLAIDGHAFETRIYAEDARNGFLPATGRLAHLRFPAGTAFERGPVRIDAGIREGDEITPHYDPMIAKLIVHGADRAQALARLSQALEGCRIAGVVTNTGFLARLANHQGFAAGEVDTGLIARDLDALTAPVISDQPLMAAALAALDLPRKAASAEPWQGLVGWRAWGVARHQVTLVQDNTAHDVDVGVLGPNVFEIDGLRVDANWRGDDLVIRKRGVEQRLGIHCSPRQITVFKSGETVIFDVPDPLDRGAGAAMASDQVTAPMPGLVTHVSAAPGQSVTEGDALMVLEAMKMEHTLRSPRDGIIAEVLAATGDQVLDGAVLIQLEAKADD